MSDSSEYAPLGPWPVLATTDALTTPIFRIERRSCRSPRTSRVHDFYVIGAPDWVNIVPLTEDGQVVMIRQYRHGTSAVSLEIPGGMVDADDPDPAYAAQRELFEETGYRAQHVETLGIVEPNPAIQNNRCHSFVARGVQRVSGQKLDGTEEIEVVEIPLVEIPQRLRNGEITHALVLVAFTWLMLADAAPRRMDAGRMAP